MKISKLFHWLYAFLMLLPCFGVGIKCAYVVFNKNAYDSYRGEYTYQIDKLYNIANLPNDNEYEGTITFNSEIFSSIYVEMNKLSYSPSPYIGISNLIVYNSNDLSYNSGFSSSDLINCTHIRYNNFNYETDTPLWVQNSQYLSRYGCLSFCNGNNPIAYVHFNTTKDIRLKFTKISSSNINIAQGAYSDINMGTVITDNTLSSVFYSSLQELNDTSFFSWANDSFVAQPMLYIGNLFGITDTHPIFTFMSYWTAISIIWLCFDIVMYLPLLVHRWLDKGVVE